MKTLLKTRILTAGLVAVVSCVSAGNASDAPGETQSNGRSQEVAHK